MKAYGNLARFLQCYMIRFTHRTLASQPASLAMTSHWAWWKQANGNHSVCLLLVYVHL